MPKRNDLKSILLIGAGPIVIGQACEFDYSGTQACKALKEEGYRVILVNSNPATIMTDPELADATYIEPIQWEVVAKIIEIERPDALLPTMGGQTALNCAVELDEHGILEKYQVELIGAKIETIKKAEDRSLFNEAMKKIGLITPDSLAVHSLEEAIQAEQKIGFPAIIRASFAMGGSGSGIAYNREELISICRKGLELSPVKELMIDKSVIGWKEFELEVVRDRQDNCIIVCSIENFDPMGIHTGDSITVAPAQTLTDKEYQKMRDAAIQILREIGVDTGGANVQFAINPVNGEMIIVEMNPRVSRSSALASKATGFPIAKVAAKLAIGYTLNELKNEITGNSIPASFEPSIDYIVTKIPRFNFDKFPTADKHLTTQMKSVGEAMAIGRTFQESLQKAIRSLEIGVNGFNSRMKVEDSVDVSILQGLLKQATPDRLWLIADGLRAGITEEEICEWTNIDPWFISQIADLIEEENELKNKKIEALSKEDFLRLKRKGFGDSRLAYLLNTKEEEVRAKRLQLGVKPVYKRIDTCSAEFATETGYMYSTYEHECEANPTTHKKIMIIGGGPNRIGQGIEFDYCCVHAVQAIGEMGYETIMVNCNPETVSTDFDVSDRLYFEPITFEEVMNIIELEKPEAVVLDYGGQTPLKLAKALESQGVKILGNSAEAIDRAENRELFTQLINELNLKQAPHVTALSNQEAFQAAEKIGYPVVVRPSYVLGGQAMRIVKNSVSLADYLKERTINSENPLLVDRFLSDATEVDVDAVSDGKEVFVCGVMEHIEQAGIHSGDSSCSYPPYSLSSVIQEELKKQITAMTLALGMKGLVNAQFAIRGEDIYVLELNPRASRTVPYISKATGFPFAKIAAWCKLGKTIQELGLKYRTSDLYSIKMPVFPFIKFSNVDSLLGPEMKSTGEVMGFGKKFGLAYSKAQLATGSLIKDRKKAFISVKDKDKAGVGNIARELVELGFSILATEGTCKVIQAASLPCEYVPKLSEGRPNIIDMIKNLEIHYIIDTGEEELPDSILIRQAAMLHKIPCSTTLEASKASCLAMKFDNRDSVTKLQDLWETYGLN